MLMMSFAAPAMAAIDPNGSYTDYNGSSLSPSAYNDLSNPTDIGTAGEGIPPEAGGTTHTAPTDGSVVVGPAPRQVDPCWVEEYISQWNDVGWYYVC
jgi:hypothetical protein